jgi:four helix bundle protein
MNKEAMKQRTRQFAIDCARLIEQLPVTMVNKSYLHQLVRSSGSVAANYRASQRAKSTADFINKLKIVEEELDESLLWIELLAEFNKTRRALFVPVFREGEELLKIIVSSIKTSRSKQPKK